MSSKTIILRTEKISKSFQGLKAVDSCSVDFEKGKITGLIGSNGAGKSTLFQLITGLEKMDSGKIFLEHQDISSLAPYKRVRKGISRTFQLAHEFSQMTVLENLLVSAPLQAGEKLWNNWLTYTKVKREEQHIHDQALEILEFLTLFPLRNNRAGTLSGGQKNYWSLAEL